MKDPFKNPPSEQQRFIAGMLLERDLPDGKDWRDTVIANILWEVLQLKKALAETHGWKADHE